MSPIYSVKKPLRGGYDKPKPGHGRKSHGGVGSRLASAHPQAQAAELLPASAHLSNYDKVKVTKYLNADGFMVSYSLEQFGRRSQRTGAILDISCSFNYRENQEWFTGQGVEWLVYGENDVNSVDLLPILPDSSVTLLRNGHLLDVYRPALSETVKATNYSQNGRKHTDFGGITLTAAQVKTNDNDRTNHDFDVVYGSLECLNDNLGGWNTSLSYSLVQNLAQSLNFSLDIIEARKPGCAELDRLLDSGTVNFSSTALMMTPARLKSLDFSAQLFQIKSRILYKQPSLSTISNIYFLPFDRQVWLSCLATFLIAFLVMCFALRAGGAFEEPYVTSADMFTLVIGFVCQQGTELNPKSLTVRTTIIMFSLCALFLYTSYSANIVALLQSSSPTVGSLKELADSPLVLAFHDNRHNRECLQGSKDKEIHELQSKKKLNDKSFISPEEGIKGIRDGSSAFSIETSRAYKMISYLFEEPEKCGLSELHIFSLPALGLPLARKSGYKEQFTRILSQQLESGLVSRALKQQIEEKPYCSSMDSGYVSVGFADFKPALLVLMYGVAASFVAFVLEVVTARLKNENVVNFKNIYI